VMLILQEDDAADYDKNGAPSFLREDVRRMRRIAAEFSIAAVGPWPAYRLQTRAVRWWPSAGRAGIFVATVRCDRAGCFV